MSNDQPPTNVLKPTTTSEQATTGDAKSREVRDDGAQAERSGLFGYLRRTAGELVSFVRKQRLWTACMLVLIAVWTIELYIVQEITLIYPNDTSNGRFAFWAPKIRFVLDLLFITTLVFGLRRRWLIWVVCGSFATYLGLMTYFRYFRRPLQLLTILDSWQEGSQLAEFTLDLIPKRVALWLALALVVQLAAIFISRNKTLPPRCRWMVAICSLLMYLGLYQVTNVLDPLHWIQTTRGVGRLGEIRGYLGPWFAEWYYLGNGQLLNEALEFRKVRYDRLSPIEADIPIHKHLVILQAESLDYNVLGHKVNGREVTPFLNRLREQAMFYRVTAMHFNGSGDADFAALNAASGSRHQNTYSIHGYPYKNTTPQVLGQCGFDVFSFHGNSGEFYNRRAAFERMGFSEIFFLEELEGHHGLRADPWGVPDHEVLDFSARLLRTTSKPTCHFVISLTTHVPYTMLPNERAMFPQPRTVVERYLNNMHYLDRCLRDYVQALGSGTTVMIYADHPTEEGDKDFAPDRHSGREFVPCFIYDSDQDLSKLQATRNKPIAISGELNLVDVINYLRAQVKRNFPPSEANSDVSEAGQ